MTVMVTGGDGYIGSHCVLALLTAGYDVMTFDNHSTGHPETSIRLANLRTDGKFHGTCVGDLLAPDDLSRAFAAYDVEAVIHFAARSQVAESMTQPALYYRNNVCGTLNLLDAMRAHGVNQIVFSSSAAVYGEPTYAPIDEIHPQRPVNPYGRTKLIIEQILDDYNQAYGLQSVRLRYFNVAGADTAGRIGEWHDPETHLIPNILRSTFQTGKTFTLFGDDYPTRDGTCVRDYVNIEDLADAHILALKYLQQGGETDVFNIGTSEGNTVKEVFTECEKVTGKKIPLTIGERRSGDPAVLVADNRKAKTVLHWKPSRTLADSIRTAYAWEQRRHVN